VGHDPNPVDYKNTLTGAEGELNGQSQFGGSPTRDPHHGDSADEEFHPYVSARDTRSEQDIADCLRSFASAYHGEWRWTFGKGQNRHTFQQAAMIHCRLRKRPTKTGS